MNEFTHSQWPGVLGWAFLLSWTSFSLFEGAMGCPGWSEIPFALFALSSPLGSQ
jgi:hypothetical protein